MNTDIKYRQSADYDVGGYGNPLGGAHLQSNELKGPRQLLRIWPCIFDFDPKSQTLDLLVFILNVAHFLMTYFMGSIDTLDVGRLIQVRWADAASQSMQHPCKSELKTLYGTDGQLHESTAHECIGLQTIQIAKTMY
jgi:hypothetical protein